VLQALLFECLSFNLPAFRRNGLAAPIKDLGGSEVDRKSRKSITTSFYPVGEMSAHILSYWITELRRDHLLGATDPLFPKIKVDRGYSGGCQAIGLERVPWVGASKLATIFKEAFHAAGLPPFSRHRISMPIDIWSRW
jgi:hypothetical protein